MSIQLVIVVARCQIYPPQPDESPAVPQLPVNLVLISSCWDTLIDFRLTGFRFICRYHV